MMPSLAGNVSDAWLTVKFELEDTRNSYRPHDVLLTLNDVCSRCFRRQCPMGGISSAKSLSSLYLHWRAVPTAWRSIAGT